MAVSSRSPRLGDDLGCYAAQPGPRLKTKEASSSRVLVVARKAAYPSDPEESGSVFSSLSEINALRATGSHREAATRRKRVVASQDQIGQKAAVTSNRVANIRPAPPPGDVVAIRVVP
jgi:hypothetical protein